MRDAHLLESRKRLFRILELVRLKIDARIGQLEYNVQLMVAEHVRAIVIRTLILIVFIPQVQQMGRISAFDQTHIQHLNKAGRAIGWFVAQSAQFLRNDDFLQDLAKALLLRTIYLEVTFDGNDFENARLLRMCIVQEYLAKNAFANFTALLQNAAQTGGRERVERDERKE